MYDVNLYYFLYPFAGIISIIGIILKKEKITYSFLAFLLTILAVFKFDHGYDYFWYWIVGDKSLVNHSEVVKIYTNLEYGVKIIYNVVRYLGYSQYFFIITGLIISYYIYKTLKRDSKLPLISLILFLIIEMGFVDFNFYIMQSLGMSIIFYYTHYILEKQKIKFMLIVILCSFLFHRSNIIALSYLLISQRKIRVSEYFLEIIIVFIFFKYLFQKLVIKILPQYNYLFYFNKNLVMANMENIKMFIILLIIIIGIYFLKKMKLKEIKKIELDKNEQFYCNIFIMGLILTIMFAKVFGGDLSKRIGSYFLFFGYITFGNVIFFLKKEILKYIKILLVIFFVLLRMFLMIKWDIAYYLNRQPYINKNGDLIARPNSKGLRLFFGKKYEDMSPYLPGENRFYKD